MGKLINLHLESKKENFQHEFIEDAIKSVVPSTWYTDDIDMHTEFPMHLIFLGVTKTVGFVLKKITTHVSSHAAFHRANHPMEITRGVSLDWCKTLPFGSTKTPFGP